MCQDGIMAASGIKKKCFSFDENEMEILHDMGIRPAKIEFSKQ